MFLFAFLPLTSILGLPVRFLGGCCSWNYTLKTNIAMENHGKSTFLMVFTRKDGSFFMGYGSFGEGIRNPRSPRS